MTPEIMNVLFSLGGAIVLFILQRKGWIPSTPTPAPPLPTPVTPVIPSPVVPVPDGGLLAIIKAFLENPVIGPLVRAEIEKLIAAIRQRILPPSDPPAPTVTP